MDLLNKVAKFEKVPFEEFSKAVKECTAYVIDDITDYIYTDREIEKLYDALKLPERSTVGSAGYDFYAPFTFSLSRSIPNRIPTGIRVRIDDGWFLGCFPRSSLGFKYRVKLDNTVGIIDSSYYNAKNYGHIFVQLSEEPWREEYYLANYKHTNDLPFIAINQGDRFMQGIFLPYGITVDDEVTEKRSGGIGSTGK